MAQNGENATVSSVQPRSIEHARQIIAGFIKKYNTLLVDLYSRKIVGWVVSDSMHTDSPLRALRMALLRRRPGRGLVHHTDRGVQYASKAYRRTLEEYGIVCSMSRRGDYWNNASGENVFRVFKDDLAYRQDWEPKAQAAREAASYIEDFYNSLRRHSAAGNMSPDAFERARQIGLQAT